MKGTGKTRVGVAAIEKTWRSGGRSVLLVPGVELKDQWVAQLKVLLPGITVAELGDGHKKLGRVWDVVVAVVHTAVSSAFDAPLGAADLLVADECHRYAAPFFRRALRDGHPSRLGLTATYERTDDGIEVVLDPFFGGVVFS